MAFVVLGCAPEGTPNPPAGDAELRVVSLVPAASGVAVALGAGDLIVGRTSDDHTVGLGRAAEVGRVLAPDRETIAALRPDLVLAWAGSDTAPLDATLAPGGSVVAAPLDRLADVAPAVRVIGAALGRTRRAERLADSLDAALERVRRSTRADPSVRALWVVWAEPPVVAGPGTLPDDLLALAGGVNVFADAPTPWPRPSPEALVARAPDVLVWPEGPGVPDFSRLPPDAPWRAWPAARVVTVDPDLMHEAGVHVAEAAARLASRLHSATSHTPSSPTRARGGAQP